MTPEELVAFAKRRHGARHWVGPMAAELDVDRTHFWRLVTGRTPIGRHHEAIIENLQLKAKLKRLAG
jgi:hypothetical protein